MLHAQRFGPYEIVARALGRDGSLGARISLGKGSAIAAASSSTTTLVVFNGEKGITGYRFSAAGERLDTTPIIIGDGYNARVASNGTDFFVAWNVGSNYWQFPSPDRLDVLGKRVTASGATDASPLPIATGGSDQILLAVASDGRDYIVVHDLTRFAVAAKHVLREGQLIEGRTVRSFIALRGPVGHGQTFTREERSYPEFGYYSTIMLITFTDGVKWLVEASVGRLWKISEPG